ncbi:MAG: sulfatase-like hydrolase/transferase, partial [Phycisphaerae bacterium]|nr:sulfatase-like hydrolase/transferase [Phycisphaerae bacterium]
RFMQTPREKPFFLVLSHYAVHTPIQAPKEVVDRYAAKKAAALGRDSLADSSATYAAMIDRLDLGVGRLLDCLDSLHIADHTLVVFTSDNGGLSTLRNSAADAPTSNAPLRAGKGWLYEGGIRVPLILRQPEVIPSGLVVQTPAITTDLYPTLLALADVSARPSQHVDGLSLEPLLRGAPIARTSLHWHAPHHHGSGSTPSGAIRNGSMKVVEWFGEGGVELFDLSNDPGERHDLAATQPDQARALRDELAQWRLDVGALMPGSPKPADTAGPAPVMADTRAPAPNIVVFMADDLGIGEVGAWGQRDIATPHIDRLARDGLRFTQFRSSAAVCAPARCSFILGQHNGHARLDDNDSDYLRATDLTLAEQLKSAGYATGLFGKWGLSWENKPESWPTAQGFDAFYGYRDQVHAHNFYPEWLIDQDRPVRTRNVVPGAGPKGSGRATVRLDYAPTLIRDRAFEFVRANKDRPFFLFWATTLPHINNEGSRGHADGGYEVPDMGAYKAMPWPEDKRSYAAQVHLLDQDLGDLRALLDSLGIAERTLIVFLSDNGATFLKRTSDGTTDVVGRWFNGTQELRG